MPLFPFVALIYIKNKIQTWFCIFFLSASICHEALNDVENLISSAINCTDYVLSNAKEQA